jgi:RimJ/RimL family protein N-acetyltransferase
MTRLRTPRLELILQTPETIRAQLDAMSPEDRAQVSPDWLARAEAAHAPDPWLHGFVAVAFDGTAIGQGAFKGPPSDGVVEIAYGVEPDREQKGYATEIAAALTDFAFSFPDIKLVCAHTLPLPDGAASQRVLVKCGFRRMGDVIDPEDGVVTRFEKERLTG